MNEHHPTLLASHLRVCLTPTVSISAMSCKLEASVLAGAGWLAAIVFTGHDLPSELQQAKGHLASRLAFIPRAVRAAALEKG